MIKAIEFRKSLQLNFFNNKYNYNKGQKFDS